MIGSGSNFQTLISVPITSTLFCKRPVVLSDETVFVQKPPFSPKIKIRMCFDNVIQLLEIF